MKKVQSLLACLDESLRLNQYVDLTFVRAEGDKQCTLEATVLNTEQAALARFASAACSASTTPTNAKSC